MPNPFHFRARIDRLVRQGFGDGPGYLCVKALDSLVRELHAPNDRARANYRLLLATDPFDVARHKLRDLYDRPGSLLPPLPLGEACPALDAGGWGESSLAPEEEELSQDDDDPL